MLILVVLGHRLQDDGGITPTMRARLNLALKIEEVLKPQKIILSGGTANPAAGASEAEAMRKFLISHGVAPQKLILEDNSLSTKQNAKFSVPIAANSGATRLLICTTPEHMHRSFLNPVRLFAAQLKKYPQIRLLSCCNEDEAENLANSRETVF